MLYSKPEWSWVGLPEMLAPVAKLQVTGHKIVIVVPFTSVTADFQSKGSTDPPTLSTLSSHVMSLSLQELVNAGGACAILSPGQFLWIPECSFVGEFNMGYEISKSLSWLAMTPWHCTAEALAQVHANVKTVHGKCCQPSEKWYSNQLQAGIGAGGVGALVLMGLATLPSTKPISNSDNSTILKFYNLHVMLRSVSDVPDSLCVALLHHCAAKCFTRRWLILCTASS